MTCKLCQEVDNECICFWDQITEELKEIEYIYLPEDLENE